MAGTFPTLSNGEVCMYPASRTVTVQTRVLRMLNDNEQRWRVCPTLSAWELNFSRLKIADVNTLRAFFETQKGQFDVTWSFPFNGATYNFCTFEQDEFTATETARLEWETTLRFRQVKKSGTYADTAVSMTYPTINNSVITQLPFGSGGRYLTTVNTLLCGMKITRAERDNAQRVWSCSYPLITNSEAQTLMDFFTAMGGRHRAFTFVDPQTGSSYTARFATDEYRRQFVNFNQNSVSLAIEQVTA